jgi:hypothetical protein
MVACYIYIYIYIYIYYIFVILRSFYSSISQEIDP